MKIFRQFIILIIALFITAELSAESYKDSTLPARRRAELLLKKMTLEEKVGQMDQYVSPLYANTSKKTGNIDSDAERIKKERVYDKIKRGEIGSLLHVLKADEADFLQSLALQSRLQIPLIIGVDALHGNGMHSGYTIYPTSIGMAATFNPELLKEINRQTAIEMRAAGMHWSFAPNVEITRDPRWGRVGETFGEDPYLTGKMGEAVVKGLQGENGLEKGRVAACIKHFIAGGEPEAGLNASPMDISERKLREIYLPPFAQALKASPATLMPAHHELNGTPCHGNKQLLSGLLRKELNFKGMVISDWLDIESIHTKHFVAPTMDEAYAIAVDAGVDMHMHGDGFFESIIASVKSGRLPKKVVDDAVLRILELKFTLGLFEEPYSSKEYKKKIFCEEHQQTALKAARQSIVLLKNQGSMLPLNASKYKKIFVVGPNGDNHNICGDWTYPQPKENIVTVYEGIKALCKEAQIDTMFFGGHVQNIKNADIEQAGKIADQADLNIVVVGENSDRTDPKRTCGENKARDNIDLPGLQQQLLERVHASGKPTVLVLINGRPLGVHWAQKNIRAIVEGFEPGCYGGQAIAEVLFGVVNPSGRLPMTFPHNVGQIPIYYNHKHIQFSRKYVMSKTGPLYCFGHGLSYTKFTYGEPQLSKSTINRKEKVTLTVSVTNSGKRDGDEVVQLYIRDLYASVSRPVKELKGFERISLKAGETRQVKFTITQEDLQIFSANNRWEVEPGEFIVMVGGTSDDKYLKKTTLIVK